MAISGSSEISSFQRVVIDLIRHQLNLMLTETFQLKEKVDFTDYYKLTMIVLREIANGDIKSPHLGSHEAKQAIRIIESMDEKEVDEINEP